MNIITKNSKSIVAFDDKTIRINDTQDILDIMATARYYSDCIGIIINKESLNEDFFDLKTRFAGEILQKLVNYHMKIAIIGDFSCYASKSLKDFIYECNEGSQIFFKNTINDAAEALASEN